MKNFKLQWLGIAVWPLMVICCDATGDKITGTYVKNSSSEFSVADDTLVVEHNRDHYYLIHRKTGFRRMDEQGKLGKLELETEEWNAAYDESSGTMRESYRDRVISFDVKNGILLVGNGRYQLIN